jgi:hypothetical protein
MAKGHEEARVNDEQECYGRGIIRATSALVSGGAGLFMSDGDGS